jgi:hypothetical protein
LTDLYWFLCKWAILNNFVASEAQGRGLGEKRALTQVIGFPTGGFGLLLAKNIKISAR